MRIEKNQKGFTLIEVLIAVFLLAVGLMSVTRMQTTAVSGNKFSKDTSIVVKLAEEMVDRIRVNGGADPASYDNLDTDNCDALSSVKAKSDCAQWAARLTGRNFGIPNARGTVDVQENVPMDRTSTVKVSLSWGSGMLGSSRTLDLITIIQIWGKSL